MYDTTIAAKLLGQFKDVNLSSVVCALKEGTTPKKVEDTIRNVKQSYRL